MRPLVLRFLFYAGLALLGAGLFFTQIFQGERYRRLGDQNRTRLLPQEAPRGTVYDRAGRPLAANRAAYDVVAMPEDLEPEMYPVLSAILETSPEELRAKIRGAREYPFTPVVLQEDISKETAFRLEEHRSELPGVSIRVSSLRYYPYGETASHVIGYIGKINPDEYEKFKNERELYGLNSQIGRAGIELLYDRQLRGWRGARQIEVNARGKLVRVLSETIPEPGEDLVVTLDLDFQKKITELIKDKHAAVAVIDLRTDELLALASTPGFDPNAFVAPGLSQERLFFLQSKEHPLIDRGVGSAYPPGSVFKLVTALAALETGKITPSTRFHCPGYFRLTPNSRSYRCWNEKGHGSINLFEAIERSCNVYFYNVAKKLSPDQIATFARQLGLGEAMHLETTNIAPGLVPDSAWKRQKFHEKWYQGETLSFGIGQSYLLVTPLQVLRLTATLAKNGVMASPHLVRGKKEEFGPEKRVAIREENIKLIKEAMLQVVQSDYGTGQLARVDFDKMAGKTGTAQVPPQTAHSWMTGFFPFDKPDIAFVVFVEHGGSGGITSAKIVKEMIGYWREMNVAKVA